MGKAGRHRPGRQVPSGAPAHRSPAHRSPGPAHRSGSRFRPEIEGLRAVAALLVAVYHIWLGRVSGGVDVFFVVAGFLMTASVLGHYRRFGYLRLSTYFGRLARRLLPNALLVLAAVSLATVALLPVTRWRQTLHDVAASALYVENWVLIRRSVDYLERDSGVSPLQHFWAMSIQGQFYLLWAVVGVVAFVLGRRTIARSLTLVIGTLAVVSFAFSLYLTAADQPVAYFHTFTRTWEFAVGGLVALLLVRRATPLRGPLASVLGWVGLGLVVTCGLLMPVGDTFPGLAALWPVAGAVLILLLPAPEPGRGPATSVQRVLGHPALTRLGASSYGIYLWHWPVLVLHLELSGSERAGLLDGLAVLVSSVLLALGSTRLVERPLRRAGERRSDRLSLAAGAGAAGILAVTTLGVASAAERPQDGEGLVGAALVATGDQGGALDLRLGSTADPAPGIAAAASDVPGIYADGCATALNHVDVVRCDYGDPGGDRVLALVGGSHSAHWLPGLDLAAQEQGWRIVTLIKDGCRFGYAAGPEDEARSLLACSEWNLQVRPMLLELAPDLVVMTSTAVKDMTEFVPDHHVEVWEELGEHGIPVLALRDNPRAPFDVPECLATHGADSTACDTAPHDALAETDPTEPLKERLPHVRFTDLSRWFCDETACPAVIGNAVVYSDDDHISRTYSTSLSGVLAVELASLSGRG